MTTAPILRTALLLFLFQLANVNGRESLLLEDGWTFLLSKEVTETPPESKEWSPVKIPHDWSWGAGPKDNGVQGDRGGYRIGGVGWYRKEFVLPESFNGQAVSVCFDGVYRKSTVFLNGQKVGERPYGFISFQYDLTSLLKKGPNILEVRVDCSKEPSSRWYHPCGIFAPVTLEATHPTSHFVTGGFAIKTPEATSESATVSLSAELLAPKGLVFRYKIFDPAGVEVNQGEMLATHPLTTEFQVKNPQRWSPDTPNLYRAQMTLWNGKEVLDEVEIPFGIRTISWDTNTGFSINDKVTKLKGVCEHLTGGPVGGAWPEPLLEWKLKLLKEMGCNAIRTAHNPQIPAFYDLCDELGIMVMDEIFDGWKRKAAQDYGALDFKKWWRRDLFDWIRRDRNHPSVIIWSMGNETGGPVAKELVAMCHSLDPTRLVTSGHSGSEFMDIYGVNGHSESQKFFKEKRPDKPFVATEAPHTWQVRGFYKTQTWYRDGYPNKRQAPFETPNLTEEEIFKNAFLAPDQMANRKQAFQSSYDNAYVRINARQNWEKMRDLSWYSGHFRWTGFDYPGEAGYVHGGWPFHTFPGGAIDLAGFEKDLYYFYRSQWQDEPMVHLLPHWTHPKMELGTLVPVVAYTNAEEVELFFDGTSLGIQKPGLPWDKMACQWMVPWKPGKLTAVARDGSQEVAQTTVRSSAEPMALKTEWDSSATGFPILSISSVDADGNLYPYGENGIFVRVEGDTRILSFENGHPADPSPPVSRRRKAFMGKARLFLEGQPTAIMVGSILGERRQLTSKLVSIDVLKLGPDGTPLTTDWKIHYTIDGSAPSRQSPRYGKAFEVPSKTTVRAVVFVGEEKALEMQEVFSPNAGLHWYSEGEETTEESSNALQAESAKFQRGTVSKSGQGFRGTGFLDFKGREGSVDFYQENDGPAGNATLVIRYAHADPGKKRPLKVMLNEKLVTTIDFPPTGSWNKDWKTVKIPVAIQEGANLLTLQSTGQSLPNLDEVEFK